MKIEKLFTESAEFRSKLKAGIATGEDFLKLPQLEAGFSALRKHKPRLFCIKLKAQYLFTVSKNNEAILEEAHTTAGDLVAESEMKEITAPSFYKILLITKLELARMKAAQGLLEESKILLESAKRILTKAKRLFPDYEKFPQPEMFGLAA